MRCGPAVLASILPGNALACVLMGRCWPEGGCSPANQGLPEGRLSEWRLSEGRLFEGRLPEGGCLRRASERGCARASLLQVSAGPRMLATRMVALVPTVLMAVFFEASNTFDAAAQLLNVGQSLLLPFALLPVVHMTANVDVMGRRWVSGRWWTGVSIGITVATVAVNGYLLVDSLVAQHDGGLTWPWMMLTISTTLLYYAIVAYYAIGRGERPAHFKCGTRLQVWRQASSVAPGFKCGAGRRVCGTHTTRSWPPQGRAMLPRLH
eukprot:363859-Chlamydomonas_euryale.AAC.2